ncbi:hypothetical protein ACB092_09G038300 [Castanea dentata]
MNCVNTYVHAINLVGYSFGSTFCGLGSPYSFILQPKNMNRYPITTKFKYMQEPDSSMGNISQVDCKRTTYLEHMLGDVQTRASGLADAGGLCQGRPVFDTLTAFPFNQVSKAFLSLSIHRIV